MTDDERAPLRVTWSPIHLPRWVLLLKYLGFAFFASVAAVAGAPSLDLTTPSGYRPIWAIIIVVSAVVSSAALMIERRPLERRFDSHYRTGSERVEMWSTLVLTSFAIAYVGAITQFAVAGDEDKQALAVVLNLVLLMPAGRFLSLVARSRRGRRIA